MTSPRPLWLVSLLALAAMGGASAQTGQPFESVDDTRRALAEAEGQGRAAQIRAEGLEAEARRTTAAADKTAREAAAVAARIQQAEAGIAASEAKARLIERQQIALRARLAERQRPVVRLTAALQRLSRRPLAFSLLQPGSVRDTMYLRAMLGTMLPEVERRTAALRAEIARGKALEAEARRNALTLREGERELTTRRNALAAVESRQRLASRAAGGIAERETERALALAEQARDLGGLVTELGKAATLRDQLAALPGPVLRPARPEEAEVHAEASPSPTASALGHYMLPLAGRLISGFGSSQNGGPRSRGIAIAARGGAQAVAPAAGRVAFAGLYRGYGNIVIIEHGSGLTTLVTGLARLDARVGQSLVAGSPLGLAGPGRPVIGLELRRNGEPVNPLEAITAQ